MALRDIAQLIDHALLHPALTDDEIRRGCELARRHEVKAVCVKPYAIALAKEVLKGSPVAISSVVGFPHGNSITMVKLRETQEALAAGAHEIDAVVNIGKVKGGDLEYVREELRALNRACQRTASPLKVIFENDFLSDAEIIGLCKICTEVGVAFAKTSTGFGFAKQPDGGYTCNGATEDHVKLMRRHCAAFVRIKASGGVRTLDDVLKFQALGCARVGTSATEMILEEAKEARLMKFIADLHIHSRHSRATSGDLTLENLWIWAQCKGISVIGVGDCIHPQWLKELEEKLDPAEPGFFKLKGKLLPPLITQVPEPCRAEVRFVLSTEISSIYKKDGELRKVHNVLILSGFKAAKALQGKLDAIGNISSDGRPILGLDARDLLEISLAFDPKLLFIPAHIWTPWFAVLGSKSGFDSIEACFEDLTPHIHALETGLSSDPAMNWRLTSLDPFVLVSNSDAHSVSKLGREANIFDCEFSYDGMYRALSDRKDTGFMGTIEFFPEEGKYHFDGHSACKVRLHPRETVRYKGMCPSCGKPVTVGVMARVEALADRPEGEKPPRARPFTSLVPLEEIIAGALKVGPSSKKVRALYLQMIARLGPELPVLMGVALKDIEVAAGYTVAEGIRRMREGRVRIEPGYDGEFGTIGIFDN